MFNVFWGIYSILSHPTFVWISNNKLTYFNPYKSLHPMEGLWMFTRDNERDGRDEVWVWVLLLKKQFLSTLQWCDWYSHSMLHDYCAMFWINSCKDWKKRKLCKNEDVASRFFLMPYFTLWKKLKIHYFYLHTLASYNLIMHLIY